jgi:hypothetical protein
MAVYKVSAHCIWSSHTAATGISELTTILTFTLKQKEKDIDNTRPIDMIEEIVNE